MIGFQIQWTRCKGRAPGTLLLSSALASVIGAEISETAASILESFFFGLGAVPGIVALFVAVQADDLAKVLALLPGVRCVAHCGRGISFSFLSPFPMRLLFLLLLGRLGDGLGSLLGMLGAV